MSLTPRAVRAKLIDIKGKTQLTIAYCRANHNSSKGFHSIFWVDATSEASLLQSFAEIAAKFSDTAAKFSNDTELRGLVEAKLKSWGLPWLMVLDGYDDSTAFKTPIEYFMPESKYSHFLITSRHSEADDLCLPESRIDVEGMSKAEACDLFFMRSGLRRTEKALKEVDKILDRLEHHALGIDFTGAYFRNRRGSTETMFAEYERRRLKIMENPPRPGHSYRKKLGKNAKDDTALNIFASIQLSYEQLGRDHEEAMPVYEHMLTLFAFLDKQTLTERVFEASCRKMKEPMWPDWLQFFVDGESWEHDIFGDMLKHLQDKLLIKPSDPIAEADEEDEELAKSSASVPQAEVGGDDEQSLGGDLVSNITLHPLIKDWLKLRLTKDQRSEYAMEATQIVQRYLEDLQNSVATFEMSQADKREALSYVVVCQENLKEFCTSAGNGSKDGRAHVLGEGDLVESGQVFALFFEYMGKIDEARELFLRIIAYRKKVSSDEDNDMDLLTSQSLFTEILRLQKDFKKAKELDEEVYRKRMRLLGIDPIFDLEAWQRSNIFTHKSWEQSDRHRQELMEKALWSAHDLGWDLEALGTCLAKAHSVDC